MKKILVIGAGAIGSYYGARLAQNGCKVIIYSRNDAEIIAKKGIFIKSYLGNFLFHPQQIIDNLDNFKEEVDYILVATKCLPNIDLKGMIAKVISKNTKIVLIQNGIYIEDEIVKNFSNNLISCIAFIGVNREFVEKKFNGVINHQEYGRLIVGAYGKNIDDNIVTNFINLFDKNLVEIEFTKNIKLERWKKLIWNGAFNPLSVVLGNKTTEQIVNNELALNLAQNIMEEIYFLAKEDECELPADIIEKNILATKKMKPYKTSMLLDFEAQRPLEIDAILGNPIKFAQSKSLNVPILSTIYAIISNLENSKKNP
ncbi:MAG: ketopantoate reductase family protein [Alphaproteobacteria bacterium]